MSNDTDPSAAQSTPQSDEAEPLQADTPENAAQLRIVFSQTRHFGAYHIMLRVARHSLDQIDQGKRGWVEHSLMAIVMSALALEAISNSFAERCLPKDWPSIERCTTREKLKRLREKLSIDVKTNPELWSTAAWLTDRRDEIVHAKPESVNIEGESDLVDWEQQRETWPVGELERHFTHANGLKAVQCVETVLNTLSAKLDPRDAFDLRSDGAVHSATIKQPL